MDRGRKAEVFLDGQPVEQGVFLIAARQALSRALGHGQCGNILTRQMHRATIGRQLAHQLIEQRGLARPVRPKDDPPLAAPKLLSKLRVSSIFCHLRGFGCGGSRFTARCDEILNEAKNPVGTAHDHTNQNEADNEVPVSR